ncbi:TPA: cysteine desulfurase-like protein [Photobacterium damselae]
MSSYLPLNHHNIDHIRRQFPALTHGEQTRLFFDGPGGSQQPESVINAYRNFFINGNSNLGGHFATSTQTHQIVDETREKVATLIGASSGKEIIFGANMTSLTFSLSRAISQDWQAGDEIILTDIDHAANRSPWVLAAKEKGVTVHYLPIQDDRCHLDFSSFMSLLSPKTKLLALSAASNLTGTYTDLAPFIELAKANGTLTYIDAVHYLPHQQIDVTQLDADFVAGSAYKFFGPHLGFVYGREEQLENYQPFKVAPATNNIPNCWETGTLNFEAITALSATIDYLASLGTGSNLTEQITSAYRNIYQYEQELSQYFLATLNQFPELTLIGETDKDKRTPTFALSFQHHDPNDIAAMLGKHHIFTWSGHLYAERLTASLNLDTKGGVLRVGMMHYNTKQEIDTFFRVLARCLKQ